VDGKLRLDLQMLTAIEALLRLLRYKLQNGFLPTAGKPKADEMKTMSAYLKKLEYIGDPPQSLLSGTRITKLLKKIRDLDEIPRNGRYFFKERVIALLQKWGTKLDQEDQTTPSTGQQIKHDDIGLSAVADEQKPANTADSQRSLKIDTKPSATGSIEEGALNMVAKSEQLTNDHGDESPGNPANENSQPTPPSSPNLHRAYKLMPEQEVIDLTSDDEVDLAAGSESPRQPADHQNPRPSVAKSPQAPKSPSPPSTSKFSSVLPTNDLTWSGRFWIHFHPSSGGPGESEVYFGQVGHQKKKALQCY